MIIVVVKDAGHRIVDFREEHRKVVHRNSRQWRVERRECLDGRKGGRGGIFLLEWDGHGLRICSVEGFDVRKPREAIRIAIGSLEPLLHD